MAEQNTAAGDSKSVAASGSVGGSVGVPCPKCRCKECPVTGGTRKTGVYVHRYRTCKNKRCQHEFVTRARLITTGPRSGQMSDEELAP